MNDILTNMIYCGNINDKYIFEYDSDYSIIGVADQEYICYDCESIINQHTFTRYRITTNATMKGTDKKVLVYNCTCKKCAGYTISTHSTEQQKIKIRKINLFEANFFI